jgi:predicted DNA-binding transcriptional regulator AlpA
MGKLPPFVDWDALPLLLNEKEAAIALGVSVSFLRKSRCEGCKKVTLETVNDEESAPPFVKIGGRVKYPTSDLREWAAGLTRRRVI